MSHVVLEPTRLAAWCQAVIRRIEGYREKEKQEIIKEIVQERNRSWWRKLWRLAPVDSETVRKEVDRQKFSWDHPFWHVDFIFSAPLDKAENLLASCRLGYRIRVNSDTIAIFTGFVKPDAYFTEKLR